ncbi:TylF/MycF family methyltransferase, partial [Helicobacter pullorum]|uniref:TylF/MycF family methyltransferase n=1 Tax=Helicobacter pullorum TaxID=35818 RepID=UPI001C52D735
GGGGDCSPINYNDHYYEVYSPVRLKELEFDKIFIANMNYYHTQQIIQSLKELGIPDEKIEVAVFGEVCKFARLNFIKMLSIQFQEKNISGAVAEFGVWRGETARYINEYFRDENFYLLDTFDGFNKKNINKETGIAKKSTTKDFSDTSLEFVKRQMPYFR